MDKKNYTSTFPIAAILGIIFITLKLAEIGTVATWSWWWVLLPFWIVPFFVIIFIMGCFVIGWACLGVAGLIEFFNKAKKK